ncbi:hypothetical protein H4R18_004081 [Coemansia javaensis]|uniref:Uncharacterized protein n=1 Tax=Coemansia javaensis TaxID=2761396 RepID=A0A9W8HBU6_9FUNG|nr:hypothetical protein H4R18_004081 [Coemansia javaensis]
MSPRVRTAFRPLELSQSPFEAADAVALRRAATSAPSAAHYYAAGDLYYAPERLELLSRLEQRWCAPQQSLSKSSSHCAAGCVAPVPRRHYSQSSTSSRPSSSGSFVSDDAASLELRGILGHADGPAASPSRSSSASSATYTAPYSSLASADHDTFHPLEEIVVRSGSPIPRPGNPMPLDVGFGAAM